jgi:hypothetical protein
MGVDQAFERFQAIRQALPPDDDRPITDNEACTRVHLIDPILKDVLGWPWERIAVEAPGGESAEAPTKKGARDVPAKKKAREARVDYVVRDWDGVCWFVIEAKKRSQPVVGYTPGTVYKHEILLLKGAVLKDKCWPIVSRQMSPYLGRYMPCFGAVSTGEQWVGFLGKLRPGNQLLEGAEAVVFRSLDDIERDFQYFYEFFSFEGVQRRALLRRLQPAAARGLVLAPHARRVVPPGGEKPVDYQGTQQFYDDLRQAMDVAFRPIRADREALAACFVESRESREAGSRLSRVANELGAALRDAVAEYPSAVESEVDAVAARKANLEAIAPGAGYLARLLGEKSAGKTVFLQRFFDLQLGARKGQVVVLWSDVERGSPFDAGGASRALLKQLGGALFGELGPSWEQFREVYRREWNQRLRLAGIADAEANLEVRQLFLRERLEAEDRDPQEALRRYAEFATRNHGRLVSLVVDNLDHLERPEAVLEWVVATHRSIFAMTTVAMEDATVWRLRRTGTDQLADHQPEQFWLHRPKVRDVVQNRCDYLKKVLTNASGGSSKTSTAVGRQKQWRWSVDAESLVRAVSAVLLDNEDTAQWIGQLCNYDLREVLEVCQQIVLSPHIRAERLLTAQVVQRIHPNQVLRTLIAPKSEQFQGLPTDRVTNVFGRWLGRDFAPLLPARLLALLRAREEQDRDRREPFAGFVALFELTELVESSTRVPRATTAETLRYLSAMKLVEPFNPADHELKDGDVRLKITPRGKLHLDWVLQQPTYVRLMAEVDPIVADEVYRALSAQWVDFLDALSRKNPVEASRLERVIAHTYVDYLLRQADACCPLIGAEEVEPIRQFERMLRATWVVPPADS